MKKKSSNGRDVMFSGVYAALITPVDSRGGPDPEGMARLIDFVVDAGVDGVCIGGGTSEYPHFELAERKAIVCEAAQHLGQRVPLITSIGAPTTRAVLELGEHAIEHGTAAVMLPMPFFYQYAQQDLQAYVQHVAQTLSAPCLLYNLAAFTNALEPDTSLRLLHDEPHVIGIKDSSGDRQALSLFGEAQHEPPPSLLCGADGLFWEALDAGWDGAISGIASCCPEVLVALYHHYREGRKKEAQRCQELLDELVEMIGRLPFPWSVRVAAEVRGFPSGPLPHPLSEARQAQIARLREEYAQWFDEHAPALQLAAAEE